MPFTRVNVAALATMWNMYMEKCINYKSRSVFCKKSPISQLDFLLFVNVYFRRNKKISMFQVKGLKILGRAGTHIAPDKAVYCIFTQLLGFENAIKFISVCTKTQ